MPEYRPSSGASPGHMAREYFCASAGGSFWQWEDDGTVLTGASGATIVFLEEVIPILAWLAPRGLPRFGSLVLLLAACRNNWLTTDEPSTAPSLGAAADHIYGAAMEDWEEVRAGLAFIHALPSALRDTAKAQASICELVFAVSDDRLTAEDSLAILTYLKRDREAGAFATAAESPTWPQRAAADLRQLAMGLFFVTEEKINTLLSTGVVEPLPEVPVILPPTSSVRDLVTNLRDDEKLGGLMAMVRSLLASISLPRRLADPDNLPLGGVSDISNRGTLDRLLLSELAYDDDVLATRIALNEALYLRREAPPRDASNQRVLVLDAGIRLWGQPRLLACAAGLAIAAASEADFELACWRPVGDQLQPVDLATKAGLREHLAALETDPHPGFALAPLAASQADPTDLPEVVLVTHANVMRDTEFWGHVREAAWPLLYILTVDGAGTVDLHRVKPQSTKHISTTVIDLEQIKAAAKGFMEAPTPVPHPPLHDNLRRTTLPVILTMEHFPLLLRPRGKPHRAIFSPDHGLLIIGQDRAVQHQPDPQYGAAQICRQFSKGQVLDRFATPEGLVHIPLLLKGDLYLATCDLVQGQCRNQKLINEVSHPVKLAWTGQHLLVANHRNMQAFKPGEDGPVASLIRPPGFVMRNSRFYTDGNGVWHWALVLRDEIVLQPFVENSLPPSLSIIVLFDQYGAEGPLALVAQRSEWESGRNTLRARVIDSTGKILRNVPGLVRADPNSYQFSPNGRHCWLIPKGLRKKYAVTPLYGLDNYPNSQSQLDPILEPETKNALNRAPKTGLKKLLSVFATHEGQLYVCSKSGQQYYRYKLSPGSRKLMFEQIHDERSIPDNFEVWSTATISATTGAQRTSLIRHRALWSDNSVAFVDNRGLLHLISSNLELPQITLSLEPGHCAAWTTKRQSCGPDYHFGAALRSHDDQEIAELLTAFCKHLPQGRSYK